MIRRYLTIASGYSRAQVTRLINQYISKGSVKRRQCTTRGFQTRYTKADIRLLAETDRLHSDLNGPAIKKICERAYQQGDQRYERLATISISHLYNLRKSVTYERVRGHKDTTRASQSTIGIRRRPNPEGQPGFIRVDTVHQGDKDGVKGLYHINAVDEVTQYEVVCTVEKISERYLIPVLEGLLAGFPFNLLEFHSDNGSEFINHNVAKLLNKLNIQLSKSRSRHSNDNALVESKNGSVIRKLLGHAHIPRHHAKQFNQFDRDDLTPYLNYHRPCFYPETRMDAKGKEKKVYRYENMMTPYEKFLSLKEPEQYLKEGITLDQLKDKAEAMTDNEAARKLQQAREILFQLVHERQAEG
ncbi:integrase catalytic domain-containing protein [Endozoicomonas arenosclerae]|uniref:integrase catalytic domain-containing protein n=9 Tax=Endozoicomonas arenosclerae TaxID=1633495 RepID=UPI00078127AC|nr:DDE-type integrase/transposase/recombinase [Endozoicomonas arenosclerae]